MNALDSIRASEGNLLGDDAQGLAVPDSLTISGRDLQSMLMDLGHFVVADELCSLLGRPAPPKSVISLAYYTGDDAKDITYSVALRVFLAVECETLSASAAAAVRKAFKANSSDGLMTLSQMRKCINAKTSDVAYFAPLFDEWARGRGGQGAKARGSEGEPPSPPCCPSFACFRIE